MMSPLLQVRTCISILAALTLLGRNSVGAFAPVTFLTSRNAAVMEMTAKGVPSHMDDSPIASSCGTFLGALGVAAAVLTSGASLVEAAYAPTTPTPTGAVQSSSVTTAELIKTMDFSLPSSYDSISDVKSSATEELTVDTVVKSGNSKKKAVKTSKPVEKKGMTEEQKAAIRAQQEADKASAAAEREADKAAAAAEREAAAAQKKAEMEQASAEKKAELEAVRAAKKASAEEKQAAAAAKKDETKASVAASNMEFVDMGLPSYSDSAVTGEKKSAFSLR